MSIQRWIGSTSLHVHPEGRWVKYEDHAALEASHRELVEALKRLQSGWWVLRLKLLLKLVKRANQ